MSKRGERKPFCSCRLHPSARGTHLKRIKPRGGPSIRMAAATPHAASSPHGTFAREGLVSFSSKVEEVLCSALLCSLSLAACLLWTKNGIHGCQMETTKK
jgi:hypothetical protein